MFGFGKMNITSIKKSYEKKRKKALRKAKKFITVKETIYIYIFCHQTKHLIDI